MCEFRSYRSGTDHYSALLGHKSASEGQRIATFGGQVMSSSRVEHRIFKGDLQKFYGGYSQRFELCFLYTALGNIKHYCVQVMLCQWRGKRWGLKTVCQEPSE
jgi:hypothetical protein